MYPLSLSTSFSGDCYQNSALIFSRVAEWIHAPDHKCIPNLHRGIFKSQSALFPLTIEAYPMYL